MTNLMHGRVWIFLALSGFACATRAPQGKSTGTNWLGCHVDADCAIVSGARCREDRVCVDRSGKPIPASVVSRPDAGPPATDAGNGGIPSSGGTGGGGGTVAAGGLSGPGSGGASGGGGGSGGDSGVGGAGGDSGGASGTSSAGGTAPGGHGGVDAGHSLHVGASSDCFSPGQNLEHAYDPGAVGCPCAGPTQGVCVRGGSTNVALVCEDSRWAAVLDGPCDKCWTPEEPEFAVANPGLGCPCDSENEQVCLQALGMRDAYNATFTLATCTDHKWQLSSPTETPCTCDSDAHCGFGGKCVDGRCARAACRVYGVDYALGASGIPDPFSCNTCICGDTGELRCTEVNCPVECPAGTRHGISCMECGTIDACLVFETACLPTCSVDEMCPAGTFCLPSTQICARVCGP